MSADKPYIGGQAVMEGVMMRSPRGIAIAVRRPDGSIALRESDWTPKLSAKLWKLPFLRGVATMVDALHAGMNALTWSAEQQLTESEKAEMQESRLGRLAYVVPLLFALGLFVAAPQGLASLAGYLGFGSGDLTDPLFHVITALAKLGIFLGYLLLISRFKDIQRFFQSHGAEHKVITTHEAGLELTVENARAQTKLHPRCGTTFLVVVVLISAVVFVAVLTPLMPLIVPAVGGTGGWFLGLAIKLPLLPVIAAIAYELQRLSARYCTKGPLRVVLWPGFLVQKITTREPSDDQLEIAIVAMRAAIWRQDASDAVPAGDDRALVYASYDEFAQNAHALRPQPPALAA